MGYQVKEDDAGLAWRRGQAQPADDSDHDDESSRMYVVTCVFDDVSAFILLSTSILANQPPSVVLTATYFGAILCLNFGHQYKLVPD